MEPKAWLSEKLAVDFLGATASLQIRTWGVLAHKAVCVRWAWSHIACGGLLHKHPRTRDEKKSRYVLLFCANCSNKAITPKKWRQQFPRARCQWSSWCGHKAALHRSFCGSNLWWGQCLLTGSGINSPCVFWTRQGSWEIITHPIILKDWVSFQVLHSCLLRPEVPARLRKRLQDATSHESGTAKPTSGHSNVARNAYRSTRRWGIAWRVKRDVYNYHCEDGSVLPIHYLHPKKLIEYLVWCHPVVVFGTPDACKAFLGGVPTRPPHTCCILSGRANGTAHPCCPTWRWGVRQEAIKHDCFQLRESYWYQGPFISLYCLCSYWFMVSTVCPKRPIQKSAA